MNYNRISAGLVAGLILGGVASQSKMLPKMISKQSITTKVIGAGVIGAALPSAIDRARAMMATKA